MMKTRIHIILLIFCLLITNLYSLPKAVDIMKEMENQQNFETDLTAKIKITQKKVDQGVKVYESIYRRSDKIDAFLIVALAPDAEKGNGYLNVGDDFWLYRRNTRTFQHINRDESISGTDARAGDFEKRKFTELYEPAKDASGKELLSEEKLGKLDVYKLELKAIVNDVTYPKLIYWVTKDEYLPRKIQSFSLSGTLMNTSYILKYTKIEGKYFFIKTLYVDEFEKGNKSAMELSGISLKKIDKKVFTKAYLENLSK